MKIGRGKPFFDQKKFNCPYIFISLAISRSRCYIGPSDLTSRSVLSDFLFFSLLNLNRVRHSHAIKQRLGAINGDLGREVDGRWRSKGSPPDKHAQGSDRTPLVLK